VYILVLGTPADTGGIAAEWRSSTAPETGIAEFLAPCKKATGGEAAPVKPHGSEPPSRSPSSFPLGPSPSLVVPSVAERGGPAWLGRCPEGVGGTIAALRGCRANRRDAGVLRRGRLGASDCRGAAEQRNGRVGNGTRVRSLPRAFASRPPA